MGRPLPAPGGGEEAEGRGGGNVGTPGQPGSASARLRLWPQAPARSWLRGCGETEPGSGVRAANAHPSRTGGFTSLRVLPAVFPY